MIKRDGVGRVRLSECLELLNLTVVVTILKIGAPLQATLKSLGGG